MDIIQIVGYKNSGKTTLVSNIIEILTKYKSQVASLKHHGHGGLPLGFEQTDSEKHKQAGALIAGVEGEGVLQLSMEKWNIEQMIAIYKLMGIEILVIEGYKHFPFPKIVLIHSKEDLSLLECVENVKVVITSIPITDSKSSYIVFNKQELDKFYEWIICKYLEKGAVP